jgi:hypothetical protein
MRLDSPAASFIQTHLMDFIETSLSTGGGSQRRKGPRRCGTRGSDRLRKEIKDSLKSDLSLQEGDEFTAGLSVDGLLHSRHSQSCWAILSQIAYYDIGLTFLGTSAWNGSGLISIANMQQKEPSLCRCILKKSSSLPVALL